VDWFTQWVLMTAAREWVSWQRRGLDLELAINISPLNLGTVRFPDLVQQICEEHGLPPGRLTLELTEGATQDAVKLMDTVTRLRLKGIGISLDDFGTGFGSLVHLRSLPFTELKVDRVFVSDLVFSGDSRAITRALIIMAHELGLTVTAEGIEDLATLEILRVFGCDRAQGFLISQPLAGDRVVEWILGQRMVHLETAKAERKSTVSNSRRATR
jgi:EAL domain-containing protein (putative c-di-GMP-specific phosphodiesterase class I)